jgi:hypothetical protein
MIGDTIPMSKPPGPGGGGSDRVYVAMTDTPNYSVGTRLRGFQEPATSGGLNRSSWALAENVSALYEREVAQPSSTGGVGAGTTFTLNGVVFLGPTGYDTTDIGKVIDVLDSNWEPILDASDNEVLPTDMEVQHPIALTWHSVYIVPLVTDTNNGDINTVGVPDNYTLNMTNPLVSSGVGVSVMNYDQWLRGMKSGVTAEIEAAFATIIDWTDNQNFKLHRPVAALGAGQNWVSGDNVFISHFCYQPRLTVAPAMPAATSYRIVHGIYATLGTLPQDALTSLKVRTAEEISAELEKYIKGGLDAAYDRLGIGPAGSGRTVTVDTRPILGDIVVSDEFGFQTQATGQTGTAGFVAYGPDVSTPNMGHMATIEMTKAVGDTQWLLGAGVTNTGNPGEVQFTGADVIQTGAASDTFLKLDLVYLDDGAGNPVDLGNAPNGIYIIDSIVAGNTFVVTYLDGTACPDMVGIALATWLRPVFVGDSGTLAPVGPNAHITNINTAYDTTASEADAVAMYAPYDQNGGTAGNFTRSFIGNINMDVALTTEQMELNTGSLANHYTPMRLLGMVGATTNDDNIFVEYLEKDTAPDDATYVLRCDNGAVPNPANPQVWVRMELHTPPNDELIWMRHHTYPFGSSVGLRHPSGSLSRTGMILGIPNAPGVSDGAAFLAKYHDRRAAPPDGNKLEAGIGVGFDDDGAVLTPAESLSWAKLREYPQAIAAAGDVDYSPQTPVTTLNGMGGGAGVEKHRFELANNTNYGYSDWKQINKNVNLALGNAADDPLKIPIRWLLNPLNVWTVDNTAGLDPISVWFPLIFPHGARLIVCDVYIAGLATVDVLAQGYGATYPNPATAVPVGPGPATFPIPLGAPPYYHDIEDTIGPVGPAAFILKVTSPPGNPPVTLSGIRFTYEYVDIFPEG